MKHYFSQFQENFCYYKRSILQNIDILRFIHHQNTARTNRIIIQPVLFLMFCRMTLKYLQFTFNYHFWIDDLLYKIIVLKETKINTVSYNPYTVSYIIPYLHKSLYIPFLILGKTWG